MGSLEAPNSLLNDQACQFRLSPTLAINELVQERLSKGQSVIHLGFGEATFPIQKDVLAAHREASDVTSYLPVAGLMKLREVSNYYPLTSDDELTDFISVHCKISNTPPGI